MRDLHAHACAEARRLMTQAEAAASGEEEIVRQRVKLFSEGLRQTELWSALYHGEKSLGRLADVERCIDTRVQLDRFQREVILPNPLHRAVILFEERAENLPGGSLAGALLRLSDQADALGALQRLASVSPLAEAKAAARAAIALRSHPQQAVQRLTNPGFEPDPKPASTPAPKQGIPAGWGVWFRPGTPGQADGNAGSGGPYDEDNAGKGQPDSVPSDELASRVE